MLEKDLKDITAEDLQAVCEARLPENRFIEFKRELPGSKDKDRFEFVKDVAAFANAEGGDLVYGISEHDGSAAELAPIVGESSDAIILRLKQILDAALEPRLDLIQIRCIPVKAGLVVVVRVPSGTYGPFRVIQGSNSRFVIRDVSYVRDMTFGEIRSAFSVDRDFRALVANEQKRAIRTISEGATWRPLKSGPALAFQMIPFATMSRRSLFDVVSGFDGHYMMMPGWGGCSHALNLDGTIFYAGRDDEVYAYSIARRDGIFELFTFSGFSFSDEKIIPALSLAQDVREAAIEFVKHYDRLQVGGPAALVLSLVGAKGRKLEMGNRYFRSAPIGDRDIMPIPPVYLEQISNGETLDPSLKSLLDVTWQAFGVQSCPYFDAAGTWLNPR